MLSGESASMKRSFVKICVLARMKPQSNVFDSARIWHASLDFVRPVPPESGRAFGFPHPKEGFALSGAFVSLLYPWELS